jgi:aminoglycoside phosphotransferase (APT) family kinase protein
VAPLQIAQETARIHSIALEHAAFCEGPEQLLSTPTVLDRLEEMLDGPEPHPPIEHGVRWLQDHRPAEHRVLRADFRLGRFMVGDDGRVAVLDWEQRIGATRPRI